jgi:hypothetical protein
MKQDQKTVEYIEKKEQEDMFKIKNINSCINVHELHILVERQRLSH